VIRLLLADRAALSRRALAEVLDKEEDLRIVAEVGAADDVVPAAVRERPEAAVLNLNHSDSLPLTDICTDLQVAVPECSVLVVLDPATVGCTGAALARHLPRVGLIGIGATPAHLVRSVRRIVRGEAVLDADLAVVALTTRTNPLTDRESEVLSLAAAGVPLREIAEQIFLSTGTVRNYLYRIVTKTGARTRIEAIRIAQKAGWI
jgi:two-component system, NarL family, response regulator DesR